MKNYCFYIYRKV